MNKVPRYRGLRILIVPVILYYMLISPVLGILYISYSPKLLKRDVTDFLKRNPTDSIIKEAENLKIAKDSIKVIDSLIHQAEELANDTIINKSKGLKFDLSQTDNKGYFGEGEKLFFNWLIIAFVLAFLFSLPFKVFFRRKRKKKKIPLFIESYCRKSILYSPLIIAAIIAIPFLIQNANLIDQLFFSEVFKEEFRKEMFLKYWSIFLLSSLLTVAFVYTWQKHNMQLKYLQHIYTPIELRKRIFKFRRGKVKYRLVFSSFLTTLLPLSIVVAYILMSITSLSELNLYEPTQGEYKVIFGEYAKMFSDVDLYEFVKNTNPHYINVVDTILMFFGIGAGIFVTIIYLFFFVSWTNSDVINPVKELLRNMQKTTGGQLENYSLVRTNDELGELSENYNVMTSKLHEYVSHIDKMNAELEQKVKERTAEIQAQKEEIEAQRDEVESQRDEIERQRDYVIEQRDLIILQKKAITDSIEYAGNIQSAILPPSDYLKSTLKEHFIFFKPRDIVSGDFYWAHQLKSSKGNKSIIVAADSTGHGVPGAFMSMLGVTLLNEIIVKKGITNPSHILDNLKDNVVNSLHQTNEIGKSKDGIDIAVCKIDYQNLKLEYAGAYNPVYILRTINNKSEQEKQKQIYEKKGYIVEMYNDKVLIELKADKNPIGISNKARNPYTLNELDLKKGDILYMFSDGYADQFGGPRRLKFLYSRFKDLLQRNSDQSMEMQKDELNKAFNTWKGHNRQVDDILVMGIKIN